MWQKTVKKVKGKLGIIDPYLASKDDITNFSNNPDNPFLISFPRTGSHWLRMMMELYFQRPFLVRTFYYPKRIDYLALHTHDLELDIHHPNVIYLYRDPVPTIYSQLRFHQNPLDSQEHINHWSDLYGRHLDKWLHQDNFTKKKTIIRYEYLRSHLEDEFTKICAHLGSPLIPAVLNSIAVQVSKEKVKEKTPHDHRVITLSQDYSDERTWFRETFGELVWKTVLQGRSHLKGNFDVH